MTLDRYLVIHEAGHVVVADALGLTPTRVEDAGEQLQVAVAMPPEPTPHEHFLGCAVAFAGMAAQIRFGEPPDCGSAQDLGIAVDHAFKVLDGVVDHEDPKRSLDPVMHRASKLAHDIVAARWTLVVEVADLIERCGGNVDACQLAEALRPNRERVHAPEVAA